MKTKSILSFLITLLFAVVLSSAVASVYEVNPLSVLSCLGVVFYLASFVKLPNMSLMATTYSPMEYLGKFHEEVFTDMVFMNRTVEKKLVRFVSGIKGNEAFTELTGTVTVEGLKADHTDSDDNGTTAFKDRLVAPVQLEFYKRFNPNTFRLSRYASTKPGVFNNVDDTFVKDLLAFYGPKLSYLMESQFWNGATSATKTAVAALTPGTAQNAVGAAEQTYVAAASTTLFDGIVTKLIYQHSALGTRIKVAGTTISSVNIDTEYQKLYDAIPSVAVQHENVNDYFIYAPHSHKKYILTFNKNSTFRDIFTVEGENYYYMGVRIEFVPLPENCMIASRWDDLMWTTDSLSDSEFTKVDKVANDSLRSFLWIAYTQNTHIVNATQKVLYLG